MNDTKFGGRPRARTETTWTDAPTAALVVEAANQGDREAIRFLYIRYAAEVFGFARRLLDPDDAEHVTAQVFEDLVGGMERHEGSGLPFETWLLCVAQDTAERIFPSAISPGDRGLEAFRASLHELAPEEAEVLVMRHALGFEPAEIAARLGKTEDSVHGLHDRARRGLRAASGELPAPRPNG
jgi:RNA polymerase sigma-70 factor (ECF subfamily)